MGGVTLNKTGVLEAGNVRPNLIDLLVLRSLLDSFESAERIQKEKEKEKYVKKWMKIQKKLKKNRKIVYLKNYYVSQIFPGLF